MSEDDNHDGPAALTDHVEDNGLLDRGQVSRRRFFLLAESVGGAAALSTLAGCTGGDGGDGSGGADTTTTMEQATTTAGGTTTTSTETQSGDLETVRMSYIPSAGTAPIWVAEEFGYFEERGIEIEGTTAVSGSKVTAQLSTGQLDISMGGVGASTFNAIANGVPLSFAADEASSTPGLPMGNRLWIREELHEDGMKLPDIDPPVTIALNASAGVGEYMLARALAAYENLTWDDFEVQTMPFPQMISAMGSGAIDIAQQVDPLGPVMRDKLGAKQIEYSNRPTPQLQIAGALIGGPFKNQRRDVARRTLEAYILGIRKFYELGAYPSDEVASIVAEAIERPPESIKISIPYFPSKNGRLWEDDVMRQQDYYVCQGYVDSAVSRDEVFASDLLEEALGNIGTVPEDEERADEEYFAEVASNSPAPWPELADHQEPETFPSEKICGQPLA